jgi:hypothetical protein
MAAQAEMTRIQQIACCEPYPRPVHANLRYFIMNYILTAQATKLHFHTDTVSKFVVVLFPPFHSLPPPSIDRLRLGLRRQSTPRARQPDHMKPSMHLARNNTKVLDPA